jgi:lipopolysaccharide transport system permease protein
MSYYRTAIGQCWNPLSRVLKFLGFDVNDIRLGLNFTQMMLRDRFLGSSLGMAWAVLNPALMLLLFCFVFGVVFQTRLPGSHSGYAFIIWLISGYGPWLFTSEALSNSTSSVTAQAGLVKNMAFKTEILPFSATAVAFVPLMICLLFLVVLLMLDGRPPNLAWLILPVILVFHVAFIVGIGLVLSASNVFMRDIGQVLPNLLTLILFTSPIFYSVDVFPRLIRPFVAWNPIYLITNGYRAPIMDGVLPPLSHLAVLAVLSAASLLFGLWFFRRLKSYFSGRI